MAPQWDVEQHWTVSRTRDHMHRCILCPCRGCSLYGETPSWLSLVFPTLVLLFLSSAAGRFLDVTQVLHHLFSLGDDVLARLTIADPRVYGADSTPFMQMTSFFLLLICNLILLLLLLLLFITAASVIKSISLSSILPARTVILEGHRPGQWCSGCI